MSKQTDLLNLTDAITVDSSNNVGIGTNSPTEPLEVSGGKIRIGNTKIGHAGSGGSWDMTFETYSGGYFERMRIDASGRVTMPYQPAFHAIYSNGYSYTFNGSNRLATYGRAILNRGNHYNTSTSLYTAPVSGVYQFSIGCAANSTTHGGGFQVVELMVNGTLIADRYSTSSDVVNTLEGGMVCTFVIALNANDTVRPQMYHSMDYYTGGSSDSWPQARNYFSGHLIG